MRSLKIKRGRDTIRMSSSQAAFHPHSLYIAEWEVDEDEYEEILQFILAPISSTTGEVFPKPWRGDTRLAHCASCGLGDNIKSSPSGATPLVL